jgi:CRP-like cAMP-binding protein
VLKPQEQTSGSWSQPWEGVVSPALTQALEGIAQRREYKAGEFIYRRGDTNRDMVGVVSGLVRMLYVAADGRELIVGLYTAGTWFGEVSVFDHQPRPTDALVTHDAQVLVAPADALMSLLDQNPLLYKDLARVVCTKLRVAFDFVEDTFLPMGIRVGKRLLDICMTHGVPITEGLLIDLRFSQEELAQMLGLTRQSVNREIKHLESLALIGQMGGKIFVRDVGGLQRWVQQQVLQAGA